MNKKYSFFFHYHKAASKKYGINKLSVHYRNVCYLVNGVECNVPIKSKNNRSQPHCTLTGKASNLTISADNIAVIS